ncbi:hypothetical protein WJX74_008456 [Apatococcus lobatus]|uniref:Uncharacterized protein n=1 Tax=Apatococcus lobatus TaxID=904363 RepID=A0AAW1S6N9_9CHLO
MPILHKCLCSTSEPHLKDQITKLSRNDRATCKLPQRELLRNYHIDNLAHHAEPTPLASIQNSLQSPAAHAG